eukprot:TRINITY_DN2394_c0_g1_i1.p2 TRINITY_DN2394_c0_g1~~TRINITY_DN2394_c0_g1_i1.p2  ORF type:complete len:179 (+),score=52.76 TRINITY_DN2394_c0_g1_i1:99-635(+)
MVSVVQVRAPCLVPTRGGVRCNQGVGLRRGLSPVRAQEEGDEQAGSDGFFSNNNRAGIGYVEQDSAGQTNIFAVEAKTYVQGSSMDSTTGAQANTTFALTAGGLAVGALALATLTNTFLAPDVTEEIYVEGQYKTLTAYRQQFASDTGMLIATAPPTITSTPEPAAETESVAVPEQLQ